jgi:hypothetical protein
MDSKFDIKRTKTFLCAVTFLSFVAGIACIGSGIWFYFHSHFIMELLFAADLQSLTNIYLELLQPDVFLVVACLLIAAGAAAIIINFLGCLGACYESKQVLTIYGCLLAMALLAEISGLIVATANATHPETNVLSEMKRSLEVNYTTGDKNAATLFFDYTMVHTHCCGVDNYEDFQKYGRFTPSKKKVPEACCMLEEPVWNVKPIDPQCVNQPTESNSYMKIGCYHSMIDDTWWHKMAAAGIGVGLSLLELLGIILAFYYAGYIITTEESNSTVPDTMMRPVYNSPWRSIRNVSVR